MAISVTINLCNVANENGRRETSKHGSKNENEKLNGGGGMKMENVKKKAPQSW